MRPTYPKARNNCTQHLNKFVMNTYPYSQFCFSVAIHICFDLPQQLHKSRGCNESIEYLLKFYTNNVVTSVDVRCFILFYAFYGLDLFLSLGSGRLYILRRGFIRLRRSLSRSLNDSNCFP